MSGRRRTIIVSFDDSDLPAFQGPAGQQNVESFLMNTLVVSNMVRLTELLAAPHEDPSMQRELVANAKQDIELGKRIYRAFVQGFKS